MTSALAQGGSEYFGWGVDRHILAATFDALNINTRATGNYPKGKEPKFPMWPRPGEDKPKKKKASVAELYKSFSGR